MSNIKPLFMWAGGKTKMLKHYAAIERPQYTRFVEPFFGGGAVFLNENPARASINDINPEIMGIYRSVRDDVDGFLDDCAHYVQDYFSTDDRKEFYYGLRKQYWGEQSPSLLYVLMRLGFNGIWQTCRDSKGLFGTPAGLLNHKSPEQVVSEENTRLWHGRLQNTALLSVDYSDVPVSPNSFVYLDPPYRGSFTTYGTKFDDSAQERVIAQALEWSEHSEVWLANRVVGGDSFFEDRIPQGKFHYFDVTYTAGRRKKTEAGFSAKQAREFVCVINKRS